MSEIITQDSVKEYFDGELRRGRRLLPDPATLGGLGSYMKYSEATNLMSQPDVRRVLDVGCNHGSVEALFQVQFPDKLSETAIEGIDISAEAIEHAKRLNLTNCNFQSYDGDTLPFPSDSFDAVVMIEVIEHVVDKERLFREVNRVLRPGGKLLVTTPNPECWPLRFEAWTWQALRKILRRPPVEKDDYLSHAGLQAVLDSTGFAPARDGSMYSQPRLFFHIRGWSFLPPLPPRLLYHYHKFCLTKIGYRNLPRFIERHFKWSLIGEVQKSG